MVGSPGTPGSGDRDLSAAATSVVPGVTWARLEDQLRWYDRKSVAAQRKYKGVKLLQLVAAAAVPVLAAADASGELIAGLGGALLILEGVQQVGQHHKLWIDYRATWEQLQREKFLFVACAGHYAGKPDPTRALAERVEAAVSRETSGWAAIQETAMGENEEKRQHEKQPAEAP